MAIVISLAVPDDEELREERIISSIHRVNEFFPEERLAYPMAPSDDHPRTVPSAQWGDVLRQVFSSTRRYVTFFTAKGARGTDDATHLLDCGLLDDELRVGISTSLKERGQKRYIDVAPSLFRSMLLHLRATRGEVEFKPTDRTAMGIDPMYRDNPCWEAPEGLPLLRKSYEYIGPHVPIDARWIQYWPPDTCALLNFDPERDLALFHRVEPVPHGGYIVQLTAEPLLITRPDHRAAYLRVMERYPEIGGRTPRARKPECAGEEDKRRERKPIILLDLAAPPLGPRDPRALQIVEFFDELTGPIDQLFLPDSEFADPMTMEFRTELLLANSHTGIPRMMQPALPGKPTIVSARVLPGPGYLWLHAKFMAHPDIVNRAGELFERLAAILSPYWSRAISWQDWLVTEQQVVGDGERDAPLHNLPALKPPSQILDPRIPAKLGWMNYWSPETAELLEFPDPARDAEWLACATRTNTGAWILKLHNEPVYETDVLRQKLAAAYARFTAVGGRSLS